MEKISSRDFMYISAVLIIPVVMLFKGMYLYFLGTFAIALLLVVFDPLFKRFRSQIDGADKFIAYNFITGLMVGVGLIFFSHLSSLLISVWFTIDIFYGLKVAKKIESINDDLEKKE
ncbi:hypothetical protein [Shewanella loihica]|uniref:Uncharacterized protein n=1 Tax=Shewanella loihica (strain ATCC BAA-1088 / PV-4) TaxID=323850 RepID=A3QJ64_SHELP|nr:hypothetical protein [Shewanella loihica]ABO25512.1 hypothetical protein Shew_3646 [Shewanella loihica PV-4]